MRKSTLAACGFIATSIIYAVGATASETIKYSYDARGRLIKIARSGTVNNNVITEYELDRVENRDRKKVTGSLNPPP